MMDLANLSDKELLELAASAGGLEVVAPIGSCGFFGLWVRSANRRRKFRWNSLRNYGDALELAVRVGMRIETPKYQGFGTTVDTYGHGPGQTVFSDDPMLQTCRAITLAAAAVQLQRMKEQAHAKAD